MPIKLTPTEIARMMAARRKRCGPLPTPVPCRYCEVPQPGARALRKHERVCDKNPGHAFVPGKGMVRP